MINEKNAEAETHFRNIGITFSTNSETARERIIPFDLIPRIFTFSEWSKLEKGVIQRSKAINAFLLDIYNQGEIVKADIIPTTPSAATKKARRFLIFILFSLRFEN